MTNPTIQQVKDPGDSHLPVFEEIAERFDKVRLRAFDLFEKRGSELGHDLEDWFKAQRELMGSATAEFTENNLGYELQIGLPGFESKDVAVTATPNEIIVHAHAKHENKSKEGTVLWTEFGSDDVYRRFETPSPVEVDRIAATLDNGLLRITAPRAAVVKQKGIAVQAG